MARLGYPGTSNAGNPADGAGTLSSRTAHDCLSSYVSGMLQIMRAGILRNSTVAITMPALWCGFSLEKCTFPAHPRGVLL